MRTSRADTNCSGRRALLISGILDSRSYSAPAMLDSNSLGRCRDGLVGAILFSAAEEAILVVARSRDDLVICLCTRSRMLWSEFCVVFLACYISKRERH